MSLDPANENGSIFPYSAMMAAHGILGVFLQLLLRFLFLSRERAVPGYARRDGRVRMSLRHRMLFLSQLVSGTSRVTSVAYLRGATTNQPAGAARTAPPLRGAALFHVDLRYTCLLYTALGKFNAQESSDCLPIEASYHLNR